MTKPSLGKQRVYRGAYSPDFKESKVTGLDDNAYNPGPQPNKYVANTEGKNRIDCSYIDRDDSVGSGPISDGRDVSHKPSNYRKG